MNDKIQDTILKATAADSVFEIEIIQSLWSDYGRIVRYGLKGGEIDSVVVKQVEFAGQRRHPRGWDTDLSHQRKLRSYQVEMAWYSKWARYCDHSCRVPACLALEVRENHE